MSADIINFTDELDRELDRAEQHALEPCEPHIHFRRTSAIEFILSLEAEWQSPRTSPSRRTEILGGLEDVARPGEKDELITDLFYFCYA